MAGNLRKERHASKLQSMTILQKKIYNHVWNLQPSYVALSLARADWRLQCRVPIAGST
ncbi:disease resistance protein RGA3 [Pyrus ussuriensis x Pyrus communis]|uniref:Disease resistance protein RGA3 n=1 Tax=Pyrus ussuriensis x Pyrus communis TaxID=2448454 RepID=A0A5N5HMH9_9ROSA|nr:disease resistance protein RGA3 [Pyrus ussuriensis x Pyrus communis]